MSNIKYIKNIQERFYRNPVGDFYLAGLQIFVKDPVSENVDLRDCLHVVFQNMPKYLYKNIKKIFIGQYPLLLSREVQALYDNGCIYLTNEHSDNYDIISDIVHEIAHAFEELHHKEIYSDDNIKNEFLAKREKLFLLLKSHDIEVPFSKENFCKPEYDREIDEYFYEHVGYEKLNNLAKEIFISPYGATSLREYFANGFENFFVNDMFLVKTHANSVYNKILNFLEIYNV